MKCAVLIVWGRPQLIGDRLGEIDARAASWLPGTEGDGVADVLYGKRAFTGQLPVTWPSRRPSFRSTSATRPTIPSSPTAGA